MVRCTPGSTLSFLSIEILTVLKVYFLEPFLIALHLTAPVLESVENGRSAIEHRYSLEEGQ